jgi:hypothetical protein
MTDDMTASIEFEHLNRQVFEGQIGTFTPGWMPEVRTLQAGQLLITPQRLLKPYVWDSQPDAKQKTGIDVPTERVIRTGRAEPGDRKQARHVHTAC